ncbi:CHASE3 domain-containing protein, partial [Micromonospora echinospora]|uniref:CHASE3 domain-containing protein n=1 Tax=Micromonospora echinospora TaxID=1877 RepID=UPI0037B1FFDF
MEEGIAQLGWWPVNTYRRGWTLRRRLLALLTVAGVLLVGLVLVEAAVAARHRSQLDTVLNRTGPLRVQGQELLNSLVDQETAIRGYAVSGDPADLAAYRDGVAQEQTLTASLDDLAQPYPQIRRDLVAVGQRSAQWRGAVAEPVIATTQQGGTAAGRALINDEARAQFEQIRMAVERLQADIFGARQSAVSAVEDSSNLLVGLLGAALALVLALGAVLMVAINRTVVTPITALAVRVRRVAEGDYHHHIEGSGPTEFRRLAVDIDAMRQKIAKDLAEVREARERIEWVNTQLQKQAEELVRSNRDLEQFAYVA